MSVTVLPFRDATADAEVYAATAFDDIPVRFVASKWRVRHFEAEGGAFRQPVRIRAYPHKEIVVLLRRGAGNQDVKWAEILVERLRSGFMKSLGWAWDEELQCFDTVLAYAIETVETRNPRLLHRAANDPHVQEQVVDFNDLEKIFYIGSEGFYNDYYDAQLVRDFGHEWHVEVTTDNAENDIPWTSDTVTRLASDVAWLEHVADDWNTECADRFAKERDEIAYFRAHRDEWEKPEIEVHELDEPGTLRAGGAR